MAEETQEKERTGKVATPAPSHLDELEEKILSSGEKEDKSKDTSGEKAKEDAGDEIIDFDWDEAMERHPKIAKLGVEDIEDVLSKYEGGLEDFQKNAEIVKELKKLGYETPSEREELFKKLATKEEVAPSPKSEQGKTFKDIRREKLSTLIPKQVVDPETEEPRSLTDEEKDRELKKLEDFAETIFPSHLQDAVNRIEAGSLDLKDELAWTLFRLQPILEKFKDDLIPDSVRAEIIEHSKEFPKTYEEIVQKATKDGKNFYSAVYHHYTSTTKKEQIEAEKKKQWESEYKANEEKRKAAQAETTSKPGEPGKAKTFSEMSLAEKEKYIEAQK